MSKIWTGLGVVIMVLVGMTTAEAAIITIDSLPGYEWISLDVTDGMSRGEVTGNLAVSGNAVEGFRYATREETSMLLRSYLPDHTTSPLPTEWNPSYSDAAWNFFIQFQTSGVESHIEGSFHGSTHEDCYDQWNITFNYGEIDTALTTDDGHQLYYVGGVSGKLNSAKTSFTAGRFSDWYGADSSLPPDEVNMESWAGSANFTGLSSLLVRTAPVPEPATMLLFGTGLVGLAGVSIRRKKK